MERMRSGVPSGPATGVVVDSSVTSVPSPRRARRISDVGPVIAAAKVAAAASRSGGWTSSAKPRPTSSSGGRPRIRCTDGEIIWMTPSKPVRQIRSVDASTMPR
jgi:hypothetical protein